MDNVVKFNKGTLWKDGDEEETQVLFNKKEINSTHSRCLKPCTIVLGIIVTVLLASCASLISYTSTLNSREKCAWISKIHECDINVTSAKTCVTDHELPYANVTCAPLTCPTQADHNIPVSSSDNIPIPMNTNWVNVNNDDFSIDASDMVDIVQIRQSFSLVWDKITAMLGSTSSQYSIFQSDVEIMYTLALEKIGTIYSLLNTLHDRDHIMLSFYNTSLNVSFLEPDNWRTDSYSISEFGVLRNTLLIKARITAMEFTEAVIRYFSTEEPAWFTVSQNVIENWPDSPGLHPFIASIKTYVNDPDIAVWLMRIYSFVHFHCAHGCQPGDQTSFTVLGGYLYQIDFSKSKDELMGDIIKFIKTGGVNKFQNNVTRVNFPVVVAQQFLENNQQSFLTAHLSTEFSDLRRIMLYLVYSQVCTRFMRYKLLAITEQLREESQTIIYRLRGHQATYFISDSKLVTNSAEINYWSKMANLCSKARINFIAPW